MYKIKMEWMVKSYHSMKIFFVNTFVETAKVKSNKFFMKHASQLKICSTKYSLICPKGNKYIDKKKPLLNSRGDL